MERGLDEAVQAALWFKRLKEISNEKFLPLFFDQHRHLPGLLLHSHQLQLPHPLTGERLSLEVAPPDHWQPLLVQCGWQPLVAPSRCQS